MSSVLIYSLVTYTCVCISLIMHALWVITVEEQHVSYVNGTEPPDLPLVNYELFCTKSSVTFGFLSERWILSISRYSHAYH